MVLSFYENTPEIRDQKKGEQKNKLAIPFNFLLGILPTTSKEGWGGGVGEGDWGTGRRGERRRGEEEKNREGEVIPSSRPLF